MKNRIATFFFSLTVMFLISCQGKTGETTATTDGADTVMVNNTNTGQGQVYHISTADSKIHWEGSKPAMATKHTGTVNISSGNITVQDGKVTGGEVIIDMATIVSTDLQGESKAKLEAHLKGSAQGKEDDFFNVSKYPTGKFQITNVTALENDPEANTMVYGNLTLRDVTKPIAFKASVNVTDGVLTATSPLFKIDRTEYGIKVLSKKFFDNLQDGFVDDEFGLRVELRATAAQNM